MQAKVYCTTSRAKKVIVGLLMFAMTVALIGFLLMELADVHVFDVFALIFGVTVPLAVLVINVVVVREVRRASNNAAVNLGLQQHQQSTSSNSAVPTAMLIATSLVYVLLIGLWSILYFVCSWKLRRPGKLQAWLTVHQAFQIFYALSRLIYVYNFYVYLITGKQFRSELYKLFFCTSSAAEN